jgi:hypothetical protein
VRRLEQEDFCRLVGALFGVATGAAIALALACLLFPAPDSGYDAAGQGTLEWARSWGRQEDREKAFFVLTLIFGGGLGYVGAAWLIAGHRISVWTIVALVALVPGSTVAIGAAMKSAMWGAAGHAGLFFAALLAALGLLRWRARDGWSVLPDRPPGTNASSPAACPGGTRAILAGALCVAITAMAVVPLDVRTVAATIGFDMHMASFLVGPATYSFAPKLLPGLDYFSQYSVGTPWLFSFFLAPTATETMVNAVWLIVAEMLFFQLTLLFFLRWLLGGWGWALVVGLVCLVLQFTTEAPLFAPSSTAARYPLLAVCAALFVHWIRRDLAWSATLALALALAGSLFLNSETGIYTCVAVAVGAALVMPRFLRIAAMTAGLAAATFVFFVLLNLVAFGPGVLQLQYFLLLLEPLMLYTGGLGAWPIEWRGGYHWLYNVISPGLALGTLGWIAAATRRAEPTRFRSPLAGLVFMALVGLLITAKFINMSVVALWQVNAIGLFIVMAWWLKALLDWLPARWPGSGPVTGGVAALASPRAAATVALALAVLAFLCTISDPRNPSQYALVSYRAHPTLVNDLLGGAAVYPCMPGRTGCSATPVSPQDVALIQSLTKPGERVALLAFQDWTTLIEAKRASKFQFLPSGVVFTERQMKESLRDIDLIFLPREPADKLGISHPDIGPILIPMLKQQFRVVGETPTMLAWRRVGSSATSHSAPSGR